MNDKGIDVIGGCHQGDINFHSNCASNDLSYKTNPNIELREQFNPIVNDLRSFDDDHHTHQAEPTAQAINSLGNGTSDTDTVIDKDKTNDSCDTNGTHSHCDLKSKFTQSIADSRQTIVKL